MSLSITNVQRENGAACNHLTITIDHEGTSRTFKTSFYEIDALLDDLTPLEQLKMLVVLWAKYRRQQSRTIQNVGIA